MKENKYDDTVFFEKYSRMDRSVKGLAGAGEWPTLERMLPDFLGKRVLDLGCGFGWHCQYAPVSYTHLIEIALIENLQREDLNPIEEALGYKNLMVQFSMTQEAISESVGKSRSAVANSLRLLSLDDELLALVREKELSEGHARALLGLSDREKRLFLASKIVEEGLSVRQTEALVKKYNTEPEEDDGLPKNESLPQAQLAVEDICGRLQSSLATKVRITSGKKKGKIEIEYYGNDDLERIVSLINHK